MGPLEYRRRCNALSGRGLRPGIVAMLLLAFDRHLLAEAERKSDAELRFISSVA